MFAPSWDPNMPGEGYVGCDMGGLYFTADSGAYWMTVPFTEIRGGNFTCVQYTNNSSIMYCLSNNGNGYTPYKTTDHGWHWDSLPADPTYGDAWSMFADPENFQHVIVTDYSNLWFSQDGGVSFGAPKYTSSSGGGCYMAGVFFDSANIYVGTNSGLLVSTNNGSTFTMQPLTGITAGQGLLSFTGAKQGGVVRFVATTADTNDLYAGLQGSDYWNLCQGVYTKDVGSNWVSRTNGIDLANDFVFYASMARNNINTAYLAGGSSYGNPEIFKTTNAGNNWSQVFLTNNNQNIYTGYCGYQGDYTWGWAECPMGFAVSPNDPDRVMMTDYGFGHRTLNGGGMWYQCYVSPATQNPPGAPTPKGQYYQSNGLEVTSVWWITWSDIANVFASYTDIRGIRSIDSGWTWSFDYTGHNQNTMYQALKHPNGTLYAATSTVHDLYQSTYLQDTRIDNGSGRILYSTNNGADWFVLHDFGHPVIFLALDSHHPNRMYASVVHHSLGGIFVSNDIQNGGGSTWNKLTNPPRTQGHPFNIYVLEDSSLVCTYSGRRDSSGAFTPSSGIFISTNNGASWLDRSDPGEQYWTKDIVIDPYDPSQNTWYVGVFSGWGGPPNNLGGLYRTTNRGISWTRINDLLWVESCTFSPHDSNHLYMTTEGYGLWFSSNIRDPNPTFDLVSNYPFSHPLRVFYNPYNLNEIWVTSFGNGLKAGDIITGVTEFQTPDKPVGEITVYPNPFSDRINIRFTIQDTRYTLQEKRNTTLKIYDISGHLAEDLSSQLASCILDHASFVSWTGYDDSGRRVPAGVYFVCLESGKKSATVKIIKSR